MAVSCHTEEALKWGGDREAGADKAMQIHSGTLMKTKLSKAEKGRGFYANEQLYCSSLRLV